MMYRMLYADIQQTVMPTHRHHRCRCAFHYYEAFDEIEASLKRLAQAAQAPGTFIGQPPVCGPAAAPPETAWRRACFFCLCKPVSKKQKRQIEHDL
ncbi:MAG: hypothetical protein ACLRPX_10920 [Ruthenibacterium sp.]